VGVRRPDESTATMSRRNRLFAGIAAAVGCTMLAACGEMAVRVKGRVVDAGGAPRQNCVVRVAQGGRTVGEFPVSGPFDETAVFRPSPGERVSVSASCHGTRASFDREIPRLPEKFNAPVDLGDVVVP
jgi:hypothetical protein